jgi:hypothetical protein
VLLLACAVTLRAGLGDNPACAVTPGANSDIGEAAKDTLLNTTHLPRAITVGASGGLAAWLAANALTQGAVLSAQDFYLLLAPQRYFLKGDGGVVVEVGTALWRPAGGCGYPAEESVEDITEATKLKALKAPSKKPFGTTMPEAVIGGSFIQVGEHLVSLIYFFEFLPCLVVMVVVRVILEG